MQLVTNNQTDTQVTGDELFTIRSCEVHVDGKLERDKRGLKVAGRDKTIAIVSTQFDVIQPTVIVNELKKYTRQPIKVKCNPNTGGLLLSTHYSKDASGPTQYEHALTLYTGHNKQYSTVLGLISMNPFCFNQVPSLMGQPDNHLIRQKHYGNTFFNKFEETLDTLPRLISDFQIHCEQLRDKSLSLTDFVDLYLENKKVREDQKNRDAIIDKIKGVYHNAPGQDKAPDNSAYKALQAVTYLNTHDIGKRVVNKLEKQYISNYNNSHDWGQFLLAA